ncbi:uncharacterized protein J3D65DRAFT_105715 [Phyllosticta citribraziliensis]|uniref:Uncharacterized protein n=1 Tax=Phyllosticta citribraziliensis TaxID=989973 RepID=A0ABR1LCU3_9PEZI
MKNGRQGARDGIRGEQQRGLTATSRRVPSLALVGCERWAPLLSSPPVRAQSTPTGSFRYDRHPTAALQGLSTRTKTRQGQSLAHHPHISRCQVRSLGAPSPHHCRCNSGHQPDARTSTAGLSRRRRRRHHVFLLACHIHSPLAHLLRNPFFCTCRWSQSQGTSLALAPPASLAGKKAVHRRLKEETIWPKDKKSLKPTLRAARAAGHRNLDGKRTVPP